MKKFVFVALCFVLLFSFASAKTVEIWSWRTQDAQVWQEVQKNLKAKGEDITIDFHDVMYRGWITPKNITS